MDKTAKVLGRCARCENLPDIDNSVGNLYLWFPIGHSLKKLIVYLKSCQLEHQLMQDEQCLLINLKENQITTIARELETVLTTKELQDTRVLFMAGARQPQLRDFSRLVKLSEFVHLSQSAWLLSMLAAKRFTSHFQPIVDAKDTSRIFGQEALLRGIDEQGSLIFPSSILSVAREANLLFQLDRAARLTAIREAVKLGLTTRVFINFTPTAVYDPAFCLRSTVKAVEQAGIPPENVVFEVTESDRAQDIDHVKKILRYYRDAGFLIALDDLGAGYSSLNLIHQLRPDFIKLDMDLVRNVYQDRYKAVITEKILDIADSLNIKTIAEGVEHLDELCWLRERGATFVQGYLIAKPVAQPVITTPRCEG